jgi:hypothetical protein
MINSIDPTYKKHQDCNSVVKYFVMNGIVRSRLYCCDHHKWLFTLTLEEEEALRQVSPELFIDD